MNRTLSNVLLFAAGAAVGSLVTWRIFKSRYELVDEDYEEYYDESEDATDEDDEASNEEIETESNYTRKPALREYSQMVKQLSYADVEVPDTDDEEEDHDVYEPYVIRPNEYGEIHAYETLQLNYYSDGVLTDDLDNPIEDVESMVPADFADHFGDYDEHAVHIRNDERQCDYEILRDLRPFSEVVGDPYPTEDE